MRNIYIVIFTITLITLMTELVLTRVFDVLLATNMAYMIITCAMFSFSLAGIYASLIDLKRYVNRKSLLPMLLVAFAVSIFIFRPIMNFLPFDYTQIAAHPIAQLSLFAIMYLFLALPFFLSGLIVISLISTYSQKIQTIYFWDLTGAAIGCIVLVPLLPPVGPGGILYFASGIALIVACLLIKGRIWRAVAFISGLLFIIVPIYHSPRYFDFNEHTSKRGVKEAREFGAIEYTRWDPISKIDVIDMAKMDISILRNSHFSYSANRKHIAYDGGAQSSWIYPFDGNFQKLREQISRHGVRAQFYNRKILASHYLKRDTHQTVLIIGSAGGVETKAALMYGAEQIDAIEMVGAVVDVVKNKYANFSGNIYNYPKVNVQVGEGRSKLRASKKKYDIIQIYSNHTTSSIAAGNGALATNYLQTVEAYEDYFQHLTDNGILHINHLYYPRMVTTAARAWKLMGKTDFQKHVVVYMSDVDDAQPAFMVKMQPWTIEEMNELKDLFITFRVNSEERNYILAEDPFHPEKSFLSPEFYSGALSSKLMEKVSYRISPPTDDKPFFSFIRKKLGKIRPDSTKFTGVSEADILNSQRLQFSWRLRFLSMDIIHLVVTAVVSLSFAIIFIFVPLYFSQAGKTKWLNKTNTLIYFSCLGSGFIIIELVFIQIFMQLIGFPLYTYSTVIFVLLFAAGMGSFMSTKLKINESLRWIIPFIGILVISMLILFTYPSVFHRFLSSPMAVRILISFLMIYPLGFFLGMPFPLGILWIENQPKGALTWAWALNGLFTVIGGFLSVLLSIYLGFRIALWVAIGIYCLAFIMFAIIRVQQPKLVHVSN